MEGHEFEHFCADLLRSNGFTNVLVTQGSADHGIDILANKKGMRYAVQCKCYTNNVGNKAIQEAYSGREIYKADIAVVMINRFFTKQAIEDARKLNVQLWDRNKVVDFICKAKGENESIIGQEYDATQNNSISQQRETFTRITEKTTKQRKEMRRMYDKEKGIYPAGIYIVGEDVEKGNYLIISNGNGYIAFYKSYSDFIKQNISLNQCFEDDYHLPLKQDGMVIEIRDCEMRRI